MVIDELLRRRRCAGTIALRVYAFVDLFRSRTTDIDETTNARVRGVCAREYCRGTATQDDTRGSHQKGARRAIVNHRDRVALCITVVRMSGPWPGSVFAR